MSTPRSPEELLQKGKECFADGNYNQAKKYANQLEHLVQNQIVRQVDLLEAQLLLGCIAIKQQEYEFAMQQLVQVKHQSNNIQQDQLYARSLLYIGILYNQVTSYNNAIVNFDSIQKKYSFLLKEPIYRHLCYSAWGKALFYTNKLSAAAALFTKLLTSAKSNQDKKTLIISLAYLSNIQTSQKNFKKALLFAKRTNNLIEQFDTDVEGLQVNLINLGNIHYQLGKYSEAVKLTSRGITAAKRLKDEFSEIKGYQVMSNIFQKQKDYKNALLYQLIYAKFFEDFFLRNERQKLREIEQAALIQELRERHSEGLAIQNREVRLEK